MSTNRIAKYYDRDGACPVTVVDGEMRPVPSTDCYPLAGVAICGVSAVLTGLGVWKAVELIISFRNWVSS